MELYAKCQAFLRLKLVELNKTAGALQRVDWQALQLPGLAELRGVLVGPMERVQPTPAPLPQGADPASFNMPSTPTPPQQQPRRGSRPLAPLAQGDGGKGYDPSKKFEGECHHCGRKGHKIRDCRDKLAGKPKAKLVAAIDGQDQSLLPIMDKGFGAISLNGFETSNTGNTTQTGNTTRTQVRLGVDWDQFWSDVGCLCGRLWSDFGGFFA